LRFTRPEPTAEPKADTSDYNTLNINIGRESRSEIGREGRGEPSIQPEAPQPVPTNDEQEKKDSVNMFNLFGSSSLSGSESRIEVDRSLLGGERGERGNRGERRELRSNENLLDDDTTQDEVDRQLTTPTERTPSVFDRSSGIPSERPAVGISSDRASLSGDRSDRISRSSIQPPTQPVEEIKKEEKPKHIWKKYVHPTLDLLDDYPENNNVNTGEIEENKRTIVDTLARFKIESEVANVTIGPAITRYDVIIADRTKIKQSLNYKESIAMALMKENVSAYLNYSKGALSIEIPNNSRATVGLKSMLTSSKFINSKPNSITFALGKNVDGAVICPDITKMPHLLVAGTTGSGKSICLSSLIVSLLYKYGPEELRFILVDPKQVEFISYDKLPHLMINEIIYDVDKAIKALNWAIKEMERRYTLFKEMTEHGKATKNLDEYNSHLEEGDEKLPKIVIILDEFGDLMMAAKKDIEGRIIKLVQKARACGIHLILATQRPSVDCITGLIKSNLPTRIGFKVNSIDDARTIFDFGGAEKLLGKGDLYFRSAESPDLMRIQGCFIDSHEVQKVTDFIKANNETYFDSDVEDFINKVEVDESASAMNDDSASDNDTKIDDTFIKALKYCVTSNQASVSMIQRRFPVGYIKACKIIDWMENMNYVTQSEGSKPRKVLLSKEEFINTYGDVDD
jgi:S-DNA-T family DNA segregation ATPase FtsK/SpoIIIE